jgi:hypothetical protein
MLHQDLRRETSRLGLFLPDIDQRPAMAPTCRPERKNNLGKLEATTPKYIVESDASIVAP